MLIILFLEILLIIDMVETELAAQVAQAG